VRRVLGAETLAVELGAGIGAERIRFRVFGNTARARPSKT
jgi:hypothetical protein